LYTSPKSKRNFLRALLPRVPISLIGLGRQYSHLQRLFFPSVLLPRPSALFSLLFLTSRAPAPSDHPYVFATHYVHLPPGCDMPSPTVLASLSFPFPPPFCCPFRRWLPTCRIAFFSSTRRPPPWNWSQKHFFLLRFSSLHDPAWFPPLVSSRRLNTAWSGLFCGMMTMNPFSFYSSYSTLPSPSIQNFAAYAEPLCLKATCRSLTLFPPSFLSLPIPPFTSPHQRLRSSDPNAADAGCSFFPLLPPPTAVLGSRTMALSRHRRQ